MGRVQARADAAGMRPVDYGRAVVLDERIVVGRKEADGNAIERLIYAQLCRLGNNLNQLVRYLHGTGYPAPASLEPLLRDIRQILEKRRRHGS